MELLCPGCGARGAEPVGHCAACEYEICSRCADLTGRFCRECAPAAFAEPGDPPPPSSDVGL